QLATALEKKGYQYQYVFALDSGHCDRKVREHTLAQALEWVWRRREHTEAIFPASPLPRGFFVSATTSPDVDPLPSRRRKTLRSIQLDFAGQAVRVAHPPERVSPDNRPRCRRGFFASRRDCASHTTGSTTRWNRLRTDSHLAKRSLDILLAT